MASSQPGSILSDAIASFTKAANHAFATVQEEARREVTRIDEEAREVLRERSEAITALHACKLDERTLQQQVDAWKATVDQANLTIKHQAQTIAQLQQEASQWKDQCLRLESTARQEAADWKEQFLRVEQERARLSFRIDELVNERLVYNSGIGAAPFTPHPLFTTLGEPSTASTTTRGASSSAAHIQFINKPGNLPSPVDHESPSEAMRGGKTPRSKNDSSRRRIVVSPPAVNDAKVLVASSREVPTKVHKLRQVRSATSLRRPPSPTRPLQALQSDGSRFIRRVQAVIEVPVKQEDAEIIEASDLSASASASTSAPDSVLQSLSLVKTQTRGRSKKQILVDDGSEEDSNVSRHQDRERSYQDSGEEGAEDDDDELMMGAEDHDKEAYRIKRINTSEGQSASAGATSASAKSASAKRKLKGGVVQNPSKSRRVDR